MSNFKAMRKKGAKKFNSIQKSIEAESGKKYKSDERYWTVTRDKAGTGEAVIRFLEAPAGEEIPFVKLWSHGFQDVGGWYIENSLTTLGQDDPMAEFNKELWESSDEDEGPERKQVRKQKRKLSYISNILVVNDPANPDNNGKVFLFKYGKKIFDMIAKMMDPKFETIKPCNPFDYDEGANFNMRVFKDGHWPSYDSSEFEKPSPVAESEKEIEAIWETQHSLQAEIAEDKFKTYDALKARLAQVLRLNTDGSVKADSKVGKKATAEDEAEDDAPYEIDENESFLKKNKGSSESNDDDDLDDEMKKFQAMADED